MWTAIKWFWNGYFNYGKSGFLKAQKEYFNESDLNQDISKKNFLVTGANSGIGYSTCLELAKRGGNVYMICRNTEKGEKSLNEIKQAILDDPNLNNNPNKTLQDVSNLHLLQCDVSLMSDCNRLIQHFKSNSIPIDVLIHNAGVMLNERKLSSEGVELTFATNLLGPFYLTYHLTDYLSSQYKATNTTKPRVIFVTSGGMLTQKMSSDYQFENLKKWDPLYTYSQTKREMVYLTELFAEKFGNRDINYYSMHPGWSSTPQLEYAMPSFNSFTKKMQRTSEQGADTIVWLSISPTVENTHLCSGLFYQDRKSVPKFISNSNTESSPKEIEDLWDYLIKLNL